MESVTSSPPPPMRVPRASVRVLGTPDLVAEVWDLVTSRVPGSGQSSLHGQGGRATRASLAGSMIPGSQELGDIQGSIMFVLNLALLASWFYWLVNKTSYLLNE